MTRRLRAILVATPLLLGCPADQTPEVTAQPAKKRVERVEPPGRVLIIGLDGASLTAVQQWTRGGVMPNLRAIREAGGLKRLTTPAPVHPPSGWTTVATGRHADAHGISRRPAGASRRMARATDRRAWALWELVEHFGLRAGVVNWWATTPATPLEHGTLISDQLRAAAWERVKRGEASAATLAQLSTTTVEPDGLPPRDALREAFGVERPFADASDLPDWVDREHLEIALEQDLLATWFAEAIEQESRPDVAMVLLGGIDRVSHALWSAVMPPLEHRATHPLTRPQEAAGQRLVSSYYALVDRLIGRLVAPYGEGDLVLVVSANGFESGTDEGDPSGIHRNEIAQRGLIAARGPGIADASSLRGLSTRHVVPIVMIWLGLPYAVDLDGAIPPFLLERGEPRKLLSYTDELGPLAPIPLDVEVTPADATRGLGCVGGEPAG